MAKIRDGRSTGKAASSKQEIGRWKQEGQPTHAPQGDPSNAMGAAVAYVLERSGRRRALGVPNNTNH